MGAPHRATFDAGIRPDIRIGRPLAVGALLALAGAAFILDIDAAAAVSSAAFGLVATAALAVATVLLVRMAARQAAITRDLMVKKDELQANRERLYRYVADLERIAQVASHDMQEPLRRVVAYAQLLADPAADDDARRDYVGQVVEGARRMRDMVRELEAFVSVEHLPQPTAAIPADAALASACARLGESLSRAGARVVAEPLPRVAADEGSLTEIFSQLIDNAVRFRDPRRSPVVTVSGGSEGGMAVLRVADNGIGIEPRHACKLFEVFQREGEPGMGLAVVRRMIERLGGRIWVDSRPGDGSVFAFTLPLEPAAAQLDQEARVAA